MPYFSELLQGSSLASETKSYFFCMSLLRGCFCSCHRRYSFSIITSDHSLHVSAINKTQSPHPELKGLRCNPEYSSCWQKSSVIIPTLLKTHEEKAKKHDLSNIAAMEIGLFNTELSPLVFICSSADWAWFCFDQWVCPYSTRPCVHKGRVGGGIAFIFWLYLSFV